MNNNEEDYIDDAFDDEAYEEEEEKKKANVVGNAHIQNDLVDKEVEQVIMKSGSTKEKKPLAGGYALPGDDDEEDEEVQDEDVDDEEVDEDHGEDEEDIDQQIVNITSKNQRAQPQPLTDEEMA